MSRLISKATAHPNIAFIKYWGNHNDELRLPANGSISMNLDGLNTTTSVEFDSKFKKDTFKLNGKIPNRTSLSRVTQFLNLIRKMAKSSLFAEVVSENNFPIGVGIASSAAAFAALAMAGSRALGLDLDQASLSRLARRGSGSACRSIPDGFVEWYMGDSDESSFANSIARESHWDLVDNIAVVSTKHKQVGSSEGHHLAPTSPIQFARVQDAPRRLDICRKAILDKDFQAFSDIVELDSNLMHAIMMTSTPPLFYWEAHSLELMQQVRSWRSKGLAACYTMDAGANVHILCLAEVSDKIQNLLNEMDFIHQVIVAKPGAGAKFLRI